jgi:alpha-mannosidase
MNFQHSRRDFLVGLGAAAALPVVRSIGHADQAEPQQPRVEVFLVPNFHPASCGWLTNFSRERVYCANSYLDHLDRVRDDPTYKFVLSEVDNMIAIMNFQPQRIEEIKRRAKEGRVELVNATFLEMTINLSGGEALIKEGIEGLRWQEQMMGESPRIAWTIDVCGTHDQMGQICSGLGLQAMVYTRMNPTGSSIHWAESPDGSRILALCPGSYADFGPLFKTKRPLTDDQLRKLNDSVNAKLKMTPAGAPVLILGGSGDYSLAPLYKGYPRGFLKQWAEVNPQTAIRISTASEYLDRIVEPLSMGRIQIPTMRGGTGYTFDSFWIENPRVKALYRSNEQALETAEALATIASLHSKLPYPTQTLYGSWILMMLNMDRNSLWGSAGGMVFESKVSWDVEDRMAWVESASRKVQQDALGAMLPEDEGVAFYNPLNWQRNDPVTLDLPAGKSLDEVSCQALPEGGTLCAISLPSTGISSFTFAEKPPEPSRRIKPPAAIVTKHYEARIDWRTGALVGLKVKPSGREMLGGPANVIVAEKPKSQQGDPGDFMLPRPERIRLAASSDFKATGLTVMTGPLVTTVEIDSPFFGGGLSRRRMRFYQEHPRIDFETVLEDIPNLTVVVAEFPLSDEIAEVRRGIPNGFSHGAWAKPNPDLHGWTKGIVPAVRWIDFSFAGGGGVALFDRGLTGRELDGKTPIIYLLNCTDKYYGYSNSWLSGRGKHCLSYSLLAHEADWRNARVSQMAREYNAPPAALLGRSEAKTRSFIRTSDNLILQALRREDRHIEMRFIECRGEAGEAEVWCLLPHRGAALTNLRGQNPQPLSGGTPYRFPVRPQQIITMRFKASAAVDAICPVTAWDTFTPPGKRAALHQYGSYKGHPPAGDE